MQITRALVTGSTILGLFGAACVWNGERGADFAGGSSGGSGSGHLGAGGRGGGGVHVDGGSVTPSPDANCGQQTYGTNRVPPDLLIVLDKSGSMDHDANDKA